MAGIGGFISGLFGSENKERATGRKVNSDNYQYGGQQGAADEAAYDYAKRGADAQGRNATQATGLQVDYGQAQRDRVQGQQARQQQSSLASIMQQRATGGAPTIAQQQADRQIGQLASAQASMAGSARGAGGLAAAQRNAAFNTANTGADISGQAQIAAGQERRDDTNAAAGMYSNLRGGDLASQQQSAAQALAATQSAAQQNQFNAGLRDAQSARNDARQLSYDQLGNQVQTTQLGARNNYEAQQSANALGAQGINAGVGGQNANMNQANGMAAVGFAQNAAGGVAGVLGKAKGGPTAGGKPYLVGEEGPELIVPQKDGYVLTHDQTRQALAQSPADAIMGLVDRGNTQTRNVSLSRLMGARAEGGPVNGDEAAVSAGQSVPQGPQVIPGYQPPMATWGAPPDTEAFERDAAEAHRSRMSPYDDLAARIAEQRGGINDTAARVNESVADIDSRDKDAIWNADYKDRHRQQLTPEEEDASAEARYRQSEDDKQKRGAAKAKRQRSLADALGDMGKKEQAAAGMIDTAYHGGGGHYAPPQLIPLSGSRAGGGPIEAGGLVPMGPMMGGGGGVGGGVELGPGGGITHNDLLRAGTGLASPQAVPGMVGGGGITGGSSMGGHGIPGFGGAREEGGPVEGELDQAAREGLTTPKKRYDPSRPFGDRFVPVDEPGPVPEGAQAAPTSTYDPSKPFGERFAPAKVRQPISFERSGAEQEKPAADSRASEIAAAVAPMLPGSSLGAGSAVAGQGIASLLASLFKNEQKKSDDEEKRTPSRLAAIMRGGK